MASPCLGRAVALISADATVFVDSANKNWFAPATCERSPGCCRAWSAVATSDCRDLGGPRRPRDHRLLVLLARGETGFRLIASGGSLMLRLRLAVSTTNAAEEHIKDRLFVDWSRSTVSNESNRVRLSRTELRLLEALLRANGATVTRLQLIERVGRQQLAPLGARERAHGLHLHASKTAERRRSSQRVAHGAADGVSAGSLAPRFRQVGAALLRLYL